MRTLLQRLRGRAAASAPSAAAPAAPGPPPVLLRPELDDAAFVDAVYAETLGRAADPGGHAHHVALLAGGMSREDLSASLAGSQEAVERGLNDRAFTAMHGSRLRWIASLPAARRILDLGGMSMSSATGALLEMGYPHPFEELVIVELPPEDRHALYRAGATDAPEQPAQGTVRYLYRSMAELSDVPDDSYDLVVSGQTFEHVTPADGRRVLAEVARVLVPGGRLALDTPNRAATALQLAGGQEEFINPDHKVEYTHPQMLALFAEHGLEVEVARGLNHLPASVDSGQFSLAELVDSELVTEDVPRSYMLAYVVRKPTVGP